MLYSVYECGLWPVGTFLLGLMGYKIYWAAITVAPILVVTYGSDRHHQRTKNRPASRLNSIAILVFLASFATFGLYYLGAAAAYLWT